MRVTLALSVALPRTARLVLVVLLPLVGWVMLTVGGVLLPPLPWLTVTVLEPLFPSAS
ncbi:hypothetical protein Mterra_00853 [Calidithermus terrae]|uniref:Uncharacterized protein n=1 Tax=Calidithermus terrae TaxID=1408545 RepID=A0A399F238_9DEIN|nr:hypothetical protein Mterra_00853 [Calidithermus terrae]